MSSASFSFSSPRGLCSTGSSTTSFPSSSNGRFSACSIATSLPMPRDEVARDTIAAIATPAGRGGIGIVRASGSKAAAIAKAVLGQGPPPRIATHGAFRAPGGERFDEGIALYFPAPHSYTGEDVLELHGHGG